MQTPDSGATAGSNPWLIAMTVGLAAFMEVLDISIANVALEHIAGSMSASQDEATWVLTSYLVTNAIVLPISGWLASTIGRKRYLLGCIMGFSVTSLLCGTAPSLSVLIVARGLQGITGGGLQPNSQAILADTFPPERRGQAFAAYGLAVVFAPAIGPTLGGWLTDNLSWRWVFLINVPVGIILSLLVARLISDPPAQVEQRRARLHAGLDLDYVGFALLLVGMGALQIVLDKGQEDDWFGSSFITHLSILAAVALVALVVWELRRADPIVDLRLLARRNFAVGNLLMFVLGFTLLGTTVLLPLYAQTMLGYTATEAGMVISPGGFALLLVMPAVGFLSGKVDARYLIAAGSRRGRAGLMVDDPLRCRDRLCHARLVADLPVARPRPAVHPDQHGGARRHADGEKQQRCGDHQHDAQHRRQCRRLGRHDLDRAARTVSPEHAGRRRDAVPQFLCGRHRAVAADLSRRCRKHRRRIASGAGAGLRDGAERSGAPILQRRLLDDGSDLGVFGAAGAAAAQAANRRRSTTCSLRFGPGPQGPAAGFRRHRARTRPAKPG